MAEMADLVIRGATRLEPGKPQDEVEVVIKKGRLASLSVLNWGARSETSRGAPGEPVSSGRTPVIDAHGMYLTPGFIDLHTHLREPGEETGDSENETIASGAAAAGAGGFTTVIAMANTDPPLDSVERFLEARTRGLSALIRVHHVAALTRGLEGRELTDMEALADAGAVAFSDDGRNAYNLELGVVAMNRALQLQRPVLVHAQDEATCPDGQADPSVAKQARVAPWPCAAEVSAVKRAIEACRRGGGHLHLQHLSCAGSVQLLERAKAQGLPVTAEATPHHMSLTARRVLDRDGADPQAKVNPPLRTEADRRAVVDAVNAGVVDAVATDHAPHLAASKALPFEQASFGFSGLETALPLCLELVDRGELSLTRLVESLTLGPWRCLQEVIPQPAPALRQGELADLVLFETKGLHIVDPATFRSRGKNSPLAGRELRGSVVATVAQGRLVHSNWLAGVA